MHTWSSPSLLVLPWIATDITLILLILHYSNGIIVSELSSVVENSCKNAWAVYMQSCRLPLGMPCHGMLDTIALKGDRDHILTLQKWIFSSQKWLHKILSAQKGKCPWIVLFPFLQAWARVMVQLHYIYYFFFLKVHSYWVQDKIDSD